MNKKIWGVVGIVFVVLTLIIIITTTVQAQNQETILDGKKIGTIADAYVEIDSTSALSRSSEKSNNEIYAKATNFVEKIGVSTNKFNESESTIKYFSNELESRLETKIYNTEATLTLNTTTGDLISYVSKRDTFPTNTLTKEEIQKKAQLIFKSIEIEEANNYKLTLLEEFDEEIWRAEFHKYYDGKKCIGESVKFSFAPENNEIVTLAINNNKYENNEIKITQEEANEIAKDYLNISSATEMTMSVEIVKPNYFYRQILEKDSNIYANINECRNAYVFTFNNEAQSKVYVDCTTGEVIGGDMKLGGEY